MPRLVFLRSATHHQRNAAMFGAGCTKIYRRESDCCARRPLLDMLKHLARPRLVVLREFDAWSVARA
jgi:hypothetical protein